jgi:hypothetical protein
LIDQHRDVARLAVRVICVGSVLSANSHRARSGEARLAGSLLWQPLAPGSCRKEVPHGNVYHLESLFPEAFGDPTEFKQLTAPVTEKIRTELTESGF